MLQPVNLLCHRYSNGMFLRLSLIQSSRFSAAPTCSIYNLHRMGVRCGMLLRLPQRKLI